MENLDPKICAEISRDIIDQYVQADQAGQKQMLLYVPVHTEDPDTQDNWPHSAVLLPRITNTLYEHGIISYPIDITVVPSVEMNEKYHLEIPQVISWFQYWFARPGKWGDAWSPDRF